MLKNTNIISPADSEEKPSPIALFEKVYVSNIVFSFLLFFGGWQF